MTILGASDPPSDGQIESWIVDMSTWLNVWLEDSGMSVALAEALTPAILGVAGLILCAISYIVARLILSNTLGFMASRSKNQWDDILIQSRAFSRLSYIAPALVVYLGSSAFPDWGIWIKRVMAAFMIFIGTLVLNALMNAAAAIYATLKFSRNRPIAGLVEVFKVLHRRDPGRYRRADRDPAPGLQGRAPRARGKLPDLVIRHGPRRGLDRHAQIQCER